MNTLFERNITDYKDEWLTPPHIIKALGPFDLDPCAPMVRPWDTAKHHFTVEDNGLVKQWLGRVWCNPPYSEILPWFSKCMHHGDTIALTFARTETKMFQRYVWEMADSIFFLYGRLKFLDVMGRQSKSGNAGAPSVLIAYGKNNVECLHSTSLPGKHILINHQTFIVVGTSPTWLSVVTIAVKNCGDEELRPLYDVVERMAPDKVEKNRHWKAKIRQTLYVLRKKTNTAA